MEPDFSWIYLIIFLAIPLARIIPRFLARRKMREADQYYQEKQTQTYSDRPQDSPQQEALSPRIKERLVLAELTKGANTFEKIQKNTGLDGKELDKILQDLEKKEMLVVQQKQGLLGPKVELYPTDKGSAEFYS